MLNKNQKRLIKALTRSDSIKEACKKVKVPRITYYYWLKTPEFVEELDKTQQETFDQSIANMRNSLKNSLNLYENLWKSNNKNTQFNAATKIIKNAGKFYGKK